MTNLKAKFEVCRSKSSPVIIGTSFMTDGRTDGLICAKQYTHISLNGDIGSGNIFESK